MDTLADMSWDNALTTWGWRIQPPPRRRPRWQAPPPRWETLKATLEEAGLRLHVGSPDSSTGGLSYNGGGFCNPKMGLYRDFAVLSAQTLRSMREAQWTASRLCARHKTSVESTTSSNWVDRLGEDSDDEISRDIAPNSVPDSGDDSDSMSWTFPDNESSADDESVDLRKPLLDARPLQQCSDRCPHVAPRPARQREQVPPVFRFLDVFAGTGALGLRIAQSSSARHQLASSPRQRPGNATSVVDSSNAAVVAGPVEVIANDLSSSCQALIRQNASENNVFLDETPPAAYNAYRQHAAQNGPRVRKQRLGPNIRVKLAQTDANVFMRLTAAASQPFEPITHVHLDPFGCVVPYLDAAISCLDVRSDVFPGATDAAPTHPKIQNLLTMTSTDLSVLFDRRYVAKAKRHYGVLRLSEDRGECFREAAARMVLASVVRACG